MNVKMEQKKELKIMMEGIENEIKEINKNKEETTDAEARIKELEKELKSLKKEIEN